MAATPAFLELSAKNVEALFEAVNSWLKTRQENLGGVLNDATASLQIWHAHDSATRPEFARLRAVISDLALPKATVYVRTLTCKEIVLQAHLHSTTVEHLKGMIEEKEGIPVDRQRLIFTGKPLQDDLPLQYYGVQDGSPIHLVLCLPAGRRMRPHYHVCR